MRVGGQEGDGAQSTHRSSEADNSTSASDDDKAVNIRTRKYFVVMKNYVLRKKKMLSIKD